LCRLAEGTPPKQHKFTMKNGGLMMLNQQQ